MVMRRLAVALFAVFCSSGAGADEVAFRESSLSNGAQPPSTSSVESLAATRERPLFSPSRRPPPAAAPVHVDAAPSLPPPRPLPPPAITLIGVIAATNGSFAVVRVGQNKQPTPVHVGDNIDGWNVIQIADIEVTLTRDGRVATFALFKGGSFRPGIGTITQRMAASQTKVEDRWARRRTAD
jgi:hypothetical protein